MPGHPGNAKGVGEHVDEFSLGDPAMTGDVVRFPGRIRISRRHQGRVGHHAGIHGAHRIVTLADDRHPVPAEFLDQAGHRCPVTLAEQPARPDNREAKPSRTGHLPEHSFALDLAACVVIEHPDVLTQRSRLVDRSYLIGRVTVSTRRADMHEPIDSCACRGLGERARGVDPANLKFLPASPVADLGGTVEDQRNIAYRPFTGSRIGEIPGFGHNPQLFEESYVAG